MRDDSSTILTHPDSSMVEATAMLVASTIELSDTDVIVLAEEGLLEDPRSANST